MLCQMSGPSPVTVKTPLAKLAAPPVVAMSSVCQGEGKPPPARGVVASAMLDHAETPEALTARTRYQYLVPELMPKKSRKVFTPPLAIQTKSTPLVDRCISKLS